MNSESIFELCKQYSEIFHLKGVRLTFTNASEREIKLKDQQPVYRRPHHALPDS